MAHDDNPAIVAGATTLLALALYLLLVPAAESAEPRPRSAISLEPRRVPGQSFCPALPRSPWMSWREIGEQLAEKGFRLVRLRLGEDRCYAATATDAAGALHTLVIHPVTAEIVARLKQ